MEPTEASQPVEVNGPLGKPPGTVRAYLAVAIVVAFLVGHLGGAVLLLRSSASPDSVAPLRSSSTAPPRCPTRNATTIATAR